MAKVDAQIKEAIKKLSKKDLEDLVVKAASMNKQFCDHLLVKYVDKEGGEQTLFMEAQAHLRSICGKEYKGRIEELCLAEMLALCNKRIVEFSKVCSDKSLELDLVMEVLVIPFSHPDVWFTTCFTKFNYQVCLLVKKAVALLQNKLHEDFRIQYAPKLNEYLGKLHRTCNYLDYIKALPEKV